MMKNPVLSAPKDFFNKPDENFERNGADAFTPGLVADPTVRAKVVWEILLAE